MWHLESKQSIEALACIFLQLIDALILCDSRRGLALIQGRRSGTAFHVFDLLVSGDAVKAAVKLPFKGLSRAGFYIKHLTVALLPPSLPLSLLP